MKGGVFLINRADYEALLPFRDHEFHVLEHPTPSRILDLERRGLLEIQTRCDRYRDELGVERTKSYRAVIICDPVGLDALTAFEQELHDQAKKKREKRNKYAFDIALAVVTFLLGLFVEHSTKIFGLVSALFGGNP